MRTTVLLTCLAALALPAGVAAAQDMTASPISGSVSRSFGFTPDPYKVNVTAGGSIQASSVSSECSGTISNAPDFEFTYTAGRQPLIVRTESATDTTLVITDPDGVWHCDDDSRGEGNAEVHLDKPSAGVYDIWVGTFGGGTAAATLILTERP